MKTTKEKESVLALRAQNYSILKISQETGLAKDTVTNILRENREEVSSLMSIETDILLKEKKLSQEARLESFARLLSSIIEELSRRTLEDVPTDKLYKMYLDTQRAVREETINLEERGLCSSEEAEQMKKKRDYNEALSWEGLIG